MKLLGFISFLFLCGSVAAQKHLVLVDRGTVVERFSEGAYIYVILKSGKKREGHIVQLEEFSMITSNDTILFNTIKKVKRTGPKKGLLRDAGLVLVAMGVGYLAIDRLNALLGYNDKELDPAVLRTSVVLAASGAVILLTLPKYVRVNRGIYLRTVDYKSPLY